MFIKTKSNISGKGLEELQTEIGKGQGVGRGGEVSSSLSIYLRVFYSCTILTLYFFHLSFGSPHGQRIVATGSQRRGDEAKVSFDCCYLFLLSPKSNAIAPLLSQCRRGDGDLSTGEV